MFPLLIIGATLGSPGFLSAQESCGKCLDVTYPPDPEIIVHRMEKGDDHACECSGGSIHDCEEGDEVGTYFWDSCEEKHGTCDPWLEEEMLSLLSAESVSLDRALTLALRHADHSFFINQHLRILGCGGSFVEIPVRFGPMVVGLW